MGKRLLEGYVGVKFTAVCAKPTLPDICRQSYDLFKTCGDRLAEHDMAPANGGNMSRRLGNHMVITASGCNLGQVEPQELTLVTSCSLEESRVTYEGLLKPSSETIMHWILSRIQTDTAAVVHAHDELATSTAIAGRLAETPREEPYGTVALARLALDAFSRGGRIVVLKNHGYVARGGDLYDAIETVLQMHLELMGLRSSS